MMYLHSSSSLWFSWLLLILQRYNHTVAQAECIKRQQKYLVLTSQTSCDFGMSCENRWHKSTLLIQVYSSPSEGRLDDILRSLLTSMILWSLPALFFGFLFCFAFFTMKNQLQWSWALIYICTSPCELFSYLKSWLQRWVFDNPGRAWNGRGGGCYKMGGKQLAFFIFLRQI